jgi:hypothetical protein
VENEGRVVYMHDACSGNDLCTRETISHCGDAENCIRERSLYMHAQFINDCAAATSFTHRPYIICGGGFIYINHFLLIKTIHPTSSCINLVMVRRKRETTKVASSNTEYYIIFFLVFSYI